MKSFIHILLIGLISGTIFFFLSNCNRTITSTGNLEPYIIKPFSNVDVKSNEFEIDPSEPTSLALENGTTISIPANILVDSKQHIVKGKVKIIYKEYQNAADILASGIPMSVDSGGKKYNFESGGMFDINGYTAEGNPVFVKKGNNISVNMASSRKDNDFTLYYLDTNERNWKTLEVSKPEINIKKQLKIDSIDIAKNIINEKLSKTIIPQKYSKSDIILNLDINYAKFEELKPFHSVIWKYSGNSDEMNPSKNLWIYSTKWTNVKLEKSETGKNNYQLSLTSFDKKFNTIVEPVLSEKEFKKIKKDFSKKMDEYNNILAELQNEEKRVKMDAEAMRSFSVAQFGIYNCDKILKMDGSLEVIANFRFDKNVNGSSKIKVYHIINSRNAVIPYGNCFNIPFTFNLKDDNSILAIMPDSRIALLSSDDFKKIKLANIGKGSQMNFTLHVTDKKVTSSEQLADIISSL